jgi:hypothetical protein
MVAERQNSIVDIPTLNDLPHMVAQSIHTAPDMTSHDNIIPYRSSQLPRSNLETLLTAVNVASHMDIGASEQQGRNDSVITYLETQFSTPEVQGRHAQSLRDPGDTQTYSL